MELLEGIIRDRADDFTAGLTKKAGFAAAQAERFLPEAGASVVAAITSAAAGLDYSHLTSSANVEAILQGIDIDLLASASGVTASDSQLGLEALVPMLLSFIAENKDARGFVMKLGGKETVRLDFWAFHTEVYFPYRTRKLMSLTKPHHTSAQ